MKCRKKNLFQSKANYIRKLTTALLKKSLKHAQIEWNNVTLYSKGNMDKGKIDSIFYRLKS